MLNKLDGLAKNKFLKSATEFLSIPTEYFLNNLSLGNNFMRAARYLRLALPQRKYIQRQWASWLSLFGKSLEKIKREKFFI